MRFFQQGDVLIESVDAIPTEAQRKSNNHVAEGEATGHYHEVVGDGVAVLKVGDVLFVDIPEDGAKVTHQEHGDISLPAGKYRSRIVQEYDHFAEEARDVID